MTQNVKLGLILLSLLACSGLFFKVLKPVFYLILIGLLSMLGLFLYSKPAVKKEVDPMIKEIKKVAEKPLKKAKQAFGIGRKEKLAWLKDFGMKIGLKAKAFAFKVGDKIEDKLAGIIVYGLFIAIPALCGWIYFKMRAS